MNVRKTFKKITFQWRYLITEKEPQLNSQQILYILPRPLIITRSRKVCGHLYNPVIIP